MSIRLLLFHLAKQVNLQALCNEPEYGKIICNYGSPTILTAMKGLRQEIMPVLFELKDLVVPGISEMVNLRLEQGMIAFMITSGDQESELLFQTLLGFQTPASGAVICKGQCLHSAGRHDLLKLRRSIGTVSARTNLISNLKVWENVTLPILYHNGTLSAEKAELATRLLEDAGLLQEIWTLPGHLASEERLMIAFIRAVLSEPELLIVTVCLDELSGRQRTTFLRMAARLQNSNDAPAVLYITTGTGLLPQMQPDTTIDLRQNPALMTRRS